MDPVPESADQREWSATTDDAGAYEVRRVIPGTYKARVGIADGSYVSMWSDLIVVAGDVITPFDASLTRGSMISGSVVDPQGDPARFVNVSLYRFEEGTWSEVDDAITSWNEPSLGRYAFTGLPAGSYAL